MNIVLKKSSKSDACHHEFVERKGVGHPDTLSDYIAETASHKYSKYCISKFGKVANHWFDKVMIIGGESDISYGVGKVLKPYTVVFAGKVTNKVGSYNIPVKQILQEACSEILGKYLTGFDSELHLVIENKLVDYQGAGRKANRYQPESESQLPSISDVSELVSNDCNLISGYAPYSILEGIVLFVEKYLTSADFKAKHPDTG
ncbi:S-adenosylmethionine synthase [Xenorhabdus miraniensis]|uniref:S-adenosylmethionine synthase n=1 Tax=Xenorhabdus miraniensis TaxID=351674 RepID=A0A2D0JJG5_9GAMM|nr:S-adenosylmethionine synthase [Xenorhabdus miraniensis]